MPHRLVRHALPELAQSRQSVFRLIAGDQASVDGPDRRADDPVRLDAHLMQRLVDARLISAERAAALKDEDRLLQIVGAVARLTLSCQRALHVDPPGYCAV